MSIAEDLSIIAIDFENEAWYGKYPCLVPWQHLDQPLISVDYVNANTICGVTPAEDTPPQVWIGSLAGETAVPNEYRGTPGGHPNGPVFAAAPATK